MAWKHLTACTSRAWLVHAPHVSLVLHSFALPSFISFWFLVWFLVICCMFHSMYVSFHAPWCSFILPSTPPFLTIASVPPVSVCEVSALNAAAASRVRQLRVLCDGKARQRRRCPVQRRLVSPCLRLRGLGPVQPTDAVYRLCTGLLLLSVRITVTQSVQSPPTQGVRRQGYLLPRRVQRQGTPLAQNLEAQHQPSTDALLANQRWARGQHKHPCIRDRHEQEPHVTPFS